MLHQFLVGAEILVDFGVAEDSSVVPAVLLPGEKVQDGLVEKLPTSARVFLVLVFHVVCPDGENFSPAVAWVALAVKPAVHVV